MQIYKNIEETKKAAFDIIKNPSLTYEQQTYGLAKLAENQLPYPAGADEKFFQLVEKGIICDLDEGHAPYAPRYILPNYDKLIKEGCEFLRLKPAKTLTDAINMLLVFYHHVPSVTRFPVYLGRIDQLLNPFLVDVDEEQAREQIKWFLIHLDRTINDSFSHANIGPEETLAGNIIIDLEKELQDVTPNLTILYDKDKTSNEFAIKCAEASLICANPAFANDKMFREDFNGDYGIASCYNGLPIGGGAFTLSRLRLNKIAANSESLEDFFNVKLPEAVDALTKFMESKIIFLAEETPFFKTSFLVTEGFINLDRFVGLFGMVGMHECVNKLMELEGKKFSFGKDDEANKLGVNIVDKILERVNNFESKYSKIWNNRYMLHSQVGAANDEGTSPGVRIAIGSEIPLYDHLKQAGMFHKYFTSGIGDHFPFDHTAMENPQAVVDIFNGGFASGMRYISAYSEDGDLIRVTGYLVKKSDLVKLNNGEQVSYDTIQYAQQPLNEYGILDRKVRGTVDKE
jgi:YjjI family glycine radical enzyme